MQGWGFHRFLDHGDVDLIVLTFGLFLSQAIQPNTRSKQKEGFFFLCNFEATVYALWCSLNPDGNLVLFTELICFCSQKLSYCHLACNEVIPCLDLICSDL